LLGAKGGSRVSIKGQEPAWALRQVLLKCFEISQCFPKCDPRPVSAASTGATLVKRTQCIRMKNIKKKKCKILVLT
jgi:hypothetical protein